MANNEIRDATDGAISFYGGRYTVIENNWVAKGDCQSSTGVSFLNNQGSGTYGFGIVVDGMQNATVQGNNLVMTPWAPQACSISNQNWYVINTAHASGSFQAGYSVRSLHWPCLGPSNQ